MFKRGDKVMLRAPVPSTGGHFPNMMNKVYTVGGVHEDFLGNQQVYEVGGYYFAFRDLIPAVPELNKFFCSDNKVREIKKMTKAQLKKEIKLLEKSKTNWQRPKIMSLKRILKEKHG